MAKRILTLCRARQWIKNILLFAAPFFAGVLSNASLTLRVAIAFVAFSAASSLGYILNDWRDQEVDRTHPIKKNRPIAARTISKSTILLTLAILLILQFTIEALLPIRFVVLINLYLITTFSYSLYFKKVAVLEHILLSSGFVIRALAGAEAARVPVSKWFLIVVGFGAIFVVSTKRYAEFQNRSSRTVRAVLTDYSEAYLQTAINVSMSISLLAYTLWVFEIQHARTWAELSLLPATLGLFRYTWHCERGEAEAPEKLIFEDPILLISGFLACLCIAVAIYSK